MTGDLGGTISVEDEDVDYDASWLLVLYPDAILVPAFSMGGYFTLSSFPLSDSDLDVASFLSVGVTLKARFRVSDAVRLRPGLTLGYNSIDHDEFDSSSQGLNVGLHADVAIATSDGEHTTAIRPEERRAKPSHSREAVAGGA